MRTSPRPDAAAKDRYYPPGYYGDARRYVFPVDYLLSRIQAKRSSDIHEANGGRPGRVLDIGCGRGLLLDQLRRRGWTVTGTELSDGAARFGREVLRLDIRVGDRSSLDFTPETFDAVVLWHVLEHVDDPAALVSEVNALIRPGGLLLVAVPNFGSLEAKLARANWLHLDVPRHVSHFTPEALLQLLKAERFKCERMGYFSPEYDFFSVIQSALNALGVRQNSLYELLRAGPAKLLRGAGAGVRMRDLLANLALAPILAPLALVWAPAAALLGRGATMIIYARKV